MSTTTHGLEPIQSIIDTMVAAGLLGVLAKDGTVDEAIVEDRAVNTALVDGPAEYEDYLAAIVDGPVPDEAGLGPETARCGACTLLFPVDQLTDGGVCCGCDLELYEEDRREQLFESLLDRFGEDIDSAADVYYDAYGPSFTEDPSWA